MTVDRTQLQDLIRDLGAMPPALAKAMRPGVIKAAQPALKEVQRRASWSRRIPRATTLSGPSGTRAGVTLRVDSTKAPHARPYEGLSGDPFRHPVFGNRENWVREPARPFFYPGVNAAADQVAEGIADVVTDVAGRHGF